MRRSQYIRSTPTRVTSLFIVGPSISISPPEATTKMVRQYHQLGIKEDSSLSAIQQFSINFWYSWAVDYNLANPKTRKIALKLKENLK